MNERHRSKGSAIQESGGQRHRKRGTAMHRDRKKQIGEPLGEDRKQDKVLGPFCLKPFTLMGQGW